MRSDGPKGWIGRSAAFGKMSDNIYTIYLQDHLRLGLGSGFQFWIWAHGQALKFGPHSGLHVSTFNGPATVINVQTSSPSKHPSRTGLQLGSCPNLDLKPWLLNGFSKDLCPWNSRALWTRPIFHSCLWLLQYLSMLTCNPPTIAFSVPELSSLAWDSFLFMRNATQTRPRTRRNHGTQPKWLWPCRVECTRDMNVRPTGPRKEIGWNDPVTKTQLDH